MNQRSDSAPALRLPMAQPPEPASPPSLADLQACLARIRDQQESACVLSTEMRRLTDVIRQLSTRGPDPLLEFGFATVSELLAQLLARLQLVVNDHLRQERSGRVELPERVQQLLPTADALSNLLLKLADAYARHRKRVTA
jgi:hypothetical protein